MFITHFCPSTVLLAIHTFNKPEILKIVKIFSLCLRVCIFTCLLFADLELFTSILDIKQGQKKDLINGQCVKISFYSPLSLFSPRLTSLRIYTYDSVYSKLQFIKTSTCQNPTPRARPVRIEEQGSKSAVNYSCVFPKTPA